MNQTKIHLGQCNEKLKTQGQSRISTLPPLEILDNNLKQFICQQNKHLSNKVEKKLAQYKDDLDEKKLFSQILHYLTPNDQVCT